MKDTFIQHVNYLNTDFYQGNTYLIWRLLEGWEVYELKSIKVNGFKTELNFRGKENSETNTINFLKYSEDYFCKLIEDGEVAENTFWNRIKAKFRTL